jgi:uncharacterized Zn finger protein
VTAVKRNRELRFDLAALRELAGDKAFARGAAYFRDGQVNPLAVEPERVLAQVSGTEDYRTSLTGRGAAIGGDCSCQAFADWGFCKHMVAAALAANAAGGGAEAVGALERIRAHLKQQSVDALVEMLLGLAERDPALFRRLDLAAAPQLDDKALEARLRRALDSAIRTGGFVPYQEAEGWAQEVGAALDALADLADGPRAAIALRLAERAIDAIEAAMEQADDSDGHCGGLLERAGDLHLAAARTARPEPLELAQALFEREMEEAYGVFARAAARYAEVLGEAGLAEYRRLAEAAWAKLPPRQGDRAGREHRGDYASLRDILDFFAEREGDVEARIALRAKDLSSPWACLQLAEFCLAQGRAEEALRRAEEGLWLFQDGRPDERLVFFAADLLARTGRRPDAEAHLWRAFEAAASLELYARLRKLGGEAARERALASLEGRLARERRSAWSHPADLLVHVLVKEKLFDRAWAIVRQHAASAGARESLANASEGTHPAEALAVYAERVEALVGAMGERAYAEAAKLVARMARLRDGAAQARYLAELKARHGRKRNFMKLLA